MLLSNNIFKKKVKKKLIGCAFILIKPFIIPIIILSVFIVLVAGITDILYIAFDNDDKIDMEKELAYYDTEYNKQNDKDEVKGFFSSVWDFVAGLFGSGEMAIDTDWPVERTIQNYKLFWKKRSSNSWCINIS